MVGVVVERHDAGVVALARAEPRQDRPAEGLVLRGGATAARRVAARTDLTRLDGGEIRGVALDEGLDNRLHDVPEEAGPRCRRPRDELHAAAGRLLRANHVLVDVNQHLTAL